MFLSHENVFDTLSLGVEQHHNLLPIVLLVDDARLDGDLVLGLVDVVDELLEPGAACLVIPGHRRSDSSQSAPLDRSVDRHYEWDKATADDSSLPSLPPEWAVRRSPAYNPRRDRDIGHMVPQSTRERVFSDSEIYSNVFPRRRLHLDVEARVRAMKKEFKEFRQTQNISPNESDRLESLI